MAAGACHRAARLRARPLAGVTSPRNHFRPSSFKLLLRGIPIRTNFSMFPKPKPLLKPNTYAYESEPMVKTTGCREYDARWLFGSEINLMGVEALGLGLGSLIHELGREPRLVTGHDFRSYSSSLKMAMVNGLLAGGCQVYDIG